MAKVPVTRALKSKIFAALLAAGVAGPSAYVAVELTVPSEGVLTHLHDDPVGKPTVCIGHLVQRGETPQKTYTEDQCVSMFVSDWIKHEQLIDNAVKVPYRSEWMRGAVTDFTFNKGIGNVKSSTMLKNLNNKDYDAACFQLTKWVYGTINGNKVVLPGLNIRAQAQYKYCMGYEPAEYRSFYQQWSGG